jgi:methanogenic corrinoid protein MtbC1
MTALAAGAADLQSLGARYLAAQLKGDRREALRLLVQEGIERGLDPLELHAVIQQAQREIGALWQQDRITIAQEHMATAISQLALSHVYQSATPARANGKRVLVACVEGELHDFPARLVADALDLAGFDVRFLGASVPGDHLLAMIEQEPPDLLVLSVTMVFNVPALREVVALVRARKGATLPLAVGGGACVWQQGLARELQAEITASSAEELVAEARTLLEADR